jgi:hypothetical protein
MAHEEAAKQFSFRQPEGLMDRVERFTDDLQATGLEVTRTPGGGFSILDLGSTSGTSLGAERVAVALLRDGDVLRLGPSAKLRFRIVDPVEESP